MLEATAIKLTLTLSHISWQSKQKLITQRIQCFNKQPVQCASPSRSLAHTNTGTWKSYISCRLKITSVSFQQPLHIHVYI